MSRPARRIPLVASSLLVVLLFAGLTAAEKPVDFNRDIRSVLSNRCFKCHGPDAAERQGGLRLDRRDGALAETDSGALAVVPGKPAESELIARITSDDEYLRMPPPSQGKPLTPAQIETFRAWIAQGAPFAQHWSYEKPVRPPLPSVENAGWPKNEVDRFVLARLEREGLSPSPEADRYALIRRLSLDLTGLPPTWEEVQAFAGDDDPHAYEKLVDRLLEKKSYGEHWARMWLDLARYADSAGYADDPPRTIWAYRDWVIRALNDNKPFDEFTIEQIAGDLLPNPSDDQLIATAMQRNTLTNNEGGTNDEEFRNVAIVDRVNTTMAVWMGTTIACAQCHNHKYDPISQEEYFRFFAIFNQSQDADRRDESPLLEVWTDEQQQQKEQWRREIDELQETLETPTPMLLEAQKQWEATFQAPLPWQPLTPSQLETESKTKLTLLGDAVIAADKPSGTDRYKLEIPITADQKLTALRLEALPDDALPGKGPGFGGGNFVVSRIQASIAPPAGSSPEARYVRVEIPGRDKILSLAEVQVFAGEKNVATGGVAKQSSTAFNGPAKLAIDGNTDGRFAEAKSTTHTAKSNDPYWEVDLKSSQAVDRIVVWNRTDANVGSRLADFRVSLLDENREVLWEKTVARSPQPSVELSPSGVRAVTFSAALADYEQKGFEAAGVIAPAAEKTKNKGWAVGGATGKPHALTLVAARPLDVKAGSTLSITIAQQSDSENHTLGRFRLSATADSRAAAFARTPDDIRKLLAVEPEKRSKAQGERLTKYYLGIAPVLKKTRDRLAKVQQQLSGAKPYTTVPIMRDLPEDKQRVTRLQHRGNFLDVGQEVTAGLPEVFSSFIPEDVKDSDKPVDRLALARWLVSDDNPLTPRVIANRYWEKLFGVGLVSTSEEFGAQGELPTNPELLDWLATELVRLDWDMKAFIKLLVTSAAYRQSSRVTPELLARDPDNTLLARGPRFRLSAEMIRDQALAVSGLLSSKMYGPPVKPPQPQIDLKAAFGSGIDWQTSQGEDRYRRGLYTTWRRSNPYPSMAAFDAPNREVCTIRRDRTNTPLQALVTLNDPVYVEAAQALARRIARSGGDSIEAQARYGFQRCLSRPPSEKELAAIVSLYQHAKLRFSDDEAAARMMATDPLGPAPEGADVKELAAWTVVGNVLLNLDEMFMKR